MSQLMSADGKWWWDGRQWQPVPAYGSPGAPGPMSSPWTLKVAIAVNLVGSFLILLLGAVIAIGSRSAEFATGVGQAIGMDETTGLDLPTLVLVAGALVILYGLYLLGVNALLGWFMIRRAAWAWIVSLVLLAIGILFELINIVTGSAAGIVWLALIQVPPLVLLLVGPTRRWCGIGATAGATPGPYYG